MSLDRALHEVCRERGQLGESDRPDAPEDPEGDCYRAAVELATESTGRAAFARAADELTWLHLLGDQSARVQRYAYEGDREALRRRLAACAAVCVAWMEALDRRGP